MGLSKKTRFDVFKRDLFTCQYCGRRPPEVVLEVDHVIPRNEGGSDEPDNLTTSCFDCNRGKGHRSLGDTLPVMDEMQRFEAIQEMQERAVMLKKQTEAAKAVHYAERDAIHDISCHWDNTMEVDGDDEYQFEKKAVQSFLRAGLSVVRIFEAVDRTKTKFSSKQFESGWWNNSPYQRWKYFCGCCWGMIREDSEDVAPEKAKPSIMDTINEIVREDEEAGHVPHVPAGDAS